MRLIYHSDAETEVIEAAQYYEGRVATLGVQFLNDADQAVSTILEDPQRWKVIEEDVRSYLMPRFPYAIYYRAFPTAFISLLSNITADTLITGGIVFQIEVAHTSSRSISLSARHKYRCGNASDGVAVGHSPAANLAHTLEKRMMPSHMKIPNLFWPGAFLLCAALVVNAHTVLLTTGSHRDFSQTTAARATEREIAARFAPVFYQALGDKPRSDYITSFDFDGDWRGDNNWEHTDDKKFSLKAFVYYSVSETATHFFIHYAVFHPRDYKGGETRGRILSELIREGVKSSTQADPTGLLEEAGVAHENDMEGCLIVVAKNGNDLDRAQVILLETLRHNQFSRYVPGDKAPKGFGLLRSDETHALLYVEPRGHGIESYTGDEKQTAKKEFVIYKFTGKAENPEESNDGSVGYELLPIEALWSKAAKGIAAGANITYGSVHDYGQISINLVQPKGRVAIRKIKVGKIGSTFLGNTGGVNMARPPWAWFDNKTRNQPLGLWFFDPATIVKRDLKADESFSTAYVRLPFWASGG